MRCRPPDMPLPSGGPAGGAPAGSGASDTLGAGGTLRRGEAAQAHALVQRALIARLGAVRSLSATWCSGGGGGGAAALADASAAACGGGVAGAAVAASVLAALSPASLPRAGDGTGDTAGDEAAAEVAEAVAPALARLLCPPRDGAAGAGVGARALAYEDHIAAAAHALTLLLAAVRPLQARARPPCAAASAVARALAPLPAALSVARAALARAPVCAQGTTAASCAAASVEVDAWMLLLAPPP